MKKNLIIVILLVIGVFSVLYAFIKADEAEKERMAAEVARNEALMEKERADELAQLAQMRAAEAMEAQSQAEKWRAELEDCQSN